LTKSEELLQMASKQLNIRVDDIHQELLEKLIETYEANKVKTNKTDMIQRSIYAFSKNVLGDYVVREVLDKHYTDPKLKE
jgi:hypothetical protein